MRVTVVKTEPTRVQARYTYEYVEATRFYVQTTPSWLARLFGARERIVTVAWHEGKFYEEANRSVSQEERTAVLRSLLPTTLPEAKMLPARGK